MTHISASRIRVYRAPEPSGIAVTLTANEWSLVLAALSIIPKSYMHDKIAQQTRVTAAPEIVRSYRQWAAVQYNRLEDGTA